MRLINASTLRLEEFSNNIPPYAILSHTWGSSADEVSFQDICGAGTDFVAKAGFSKIKFCAKQALEDDLQYCWVDTCCIDKSSSSELSEAINSMYAWYAKSGVCYIYLSDVDKADTRVDMDEQFANSRWFTRGWTLQELISPRKRFFYDASWELIGKLLNSCFSSLPKRNGFFCGFLPEMDDFRGQDESLLKQISAITGIAEEVLETGDIQHYPTCNKMAWAAKRHTTRVEDLAYCLIGIFGVNMPLLYGEGEKAFLRLQEEIIKTKVDHTIFLWHEEEAAQRKTTSFCGMLSPSIRNFQTRKGMLPGGRAMSSYDMTNNGLRIQLPLIANDKDPNEYQALLDIDYLGNPNLVFINLRRINLEGQFARVDVQESIDHVILRRKVSFAAAQLTWVHCQNFFDRVPAIPSYQRLSRVVIKNNVPDEQMAIASVWDDLDGRGFDFAGMSFPYAPFVEFEARIVLDCTASSKNRMGRLPTYIGWRIGATRWLELQTQLILLKQPSEIRDEDLDWKSKVILKNFSSHYWHSTGQDYSEISSQTEFVIVDGEMVAEISLKKGGVVLLNGRRRPGDVGDTAYPSVPAMKARKMPARYTTRALQNRWRQQVKRERQRERAFERQRKQ